MAEAKKVVMTYDGLKKMEQELENLKTVRRKEVAEKIKEARGQGDLSENAEYDAAKEEQGEIPPRPAGKPAAQRGSHRRRRTENGRSQPGLQSNSTGRGI